MTEDIQTLIELLYEANAQIPILLKFTGDFKAPVERVKAFLSQDATEASDLLEMLLAGNVLIKDDENVRLGSAWPEFAKESQKFINIDNIIVRNLGMSRQVYDEIVRGYDDIVKELKLIDDILANFLDISEEEKRFFILGMRFEKSLTATILNDFMTRMNNLVGYTNDCARWAETMLGKGEE